MPDLPPTFLALGYCYLQIELLTRQMRYASNLDETYFKGTAVAAAVAAVEGNFELAREKLSACFNVLAEERDHYYPVDAFVLDLNLTASTTLGEALRAELSRRAPTQCSDFGRSRGGNGRQGAGDVCRAERRPGGRARRPDRRRSERRATAAAVARVDSGRAAVAAWPNTRSCWAGGHDVLAAGDMA